MGAGFQTRLNKIRILRALLFLLSTAALLLVVSGCERVKEPDTQKQATVGGGPGAAAAVSDLDIIRSMEQAFVRVADDTVPSVVNISTTPKIKQKDTTEKKPFLHDFFEGIFPMIPHGAETSLGSGVVISDKGYIVTNEHVIRDAGEITIRLFDSSEYKARVIGADPKTDIAVLKVSAERKLVPAKLGDSSDLRVGQWAIAVGNPFGLNSTVTVGVISGKGRTDIGIETYEDFIQTDASINPGNSGGPLLNLDGEVIGINTAIISSGQGIGFAIPITLVKNITEQIIKTGGVRRGWLGVGIQDLTVDLAASFGIPQQVGVLINNIFAGSPAEKAGLLRGDIVFAFNGEPVNSVREFQRMVATYEVGKKASVDVMREGKKISLDAVIADSPKESDIFSFKDPEADVLGLVVGDIPESIKKSVGVTGGVRIEAVLPGAPAYLAGMRNEDIIIDLNRMKVGDVADYNKIIDSLEGGDVLSALVLRKGRTLYLALKIM
ncbi:MAG: Do family serine endopeptidase [Deltaproteobacteria bacterium]|nr:Do family serine endopeptidase [Deltaproteobacteria bacterium]NIS78552.1 Do family serine endopeptidase [Deltaproteobacteria bacterium]